MKKIRLFMTGLLLVVTASIYAQNLQVTGTVTDASTGDVVPFASIQIKGTSTGTATDDLGQYSINVPKNGTLVFSFIGYTTQEVPVNGRDVINAILESDAETLKETVVVAFGTSSREAFTGSAAVLGAEQISRSQATSVTKALAGAVPGVQLTSATGAPGESSTIRIRGFSSMSAKMDPLIIVDGAPYSGDISHLSQNDIESMTVLKDAASNALYGARGANGVIMITTKRAKRGEAVVTVDIKAGINQRALKSYDYITDPGQYYETFFKSRMDDLMVDGTFSANDALIKANADIAKAAGDGGLGYMVYDFPDGELFIGADGKINPNAKLGNVVGDYYLLPDDWKDIAYRNGIRQEYVVTVSGADEKISYYSSISYLNDQGITDASYMNRITGRLKADYQAKKWLKMGVNMSYTNFSSTELLNNESSTNTGNMWAFTSNMAPIYPFWVRTADGNIKKDQWGFDEMDYGAGQMGVDRPYMRNSNAIADLKNGGGYTHEGNAATGNVFFEADIVEGLKVIVNGTFNLNETRTTDVRNPFYGQFADGNGLVGKRHTRDYDYNFQQLINYNKEFGKHNIGIMLGHEYTNDKYYYLYGSKSSMFDIGNTELGGSVIDEKGANSYIDEYNNEGYFARAQYDYDAKIFLSGSYRRDASSRFANKHRWGNFWSVGGAWLINKENWFNASWVNEFKLKASIGSQGNDNIDDYSYVDMYRIMNSGGLVATMFDTRGTEDLTWETNLNLNVGLEFSLFENRLFGSLEYFDRKTTDMLFKFPVPLSLGYEEYWSNVGDMKNQGAELILNFNILNKKNFVWDISLNGTFLKNNIIRLDEDKKNTTRYSASGKAYEGYVDGSFFVGEGLSMYSWTMREWAGVDQETGEALWYKDVLDADGERTGEREKTKEYNSATHYVNEETTIAPFYGGFGTSLAFYGFDFSINLSYQIGGKQYDGRYAGSMAPQTSSNTGSNIHMDVAKAWTPENPNSAFPRNQFGDIYPSSQSTRFLTDASYLNIENINFGYTLPKRWTKSFTGDSGSLRIYFACENVAYFSARQGFDPRGGYLADSVSPASYSPMRTISGGLTLKF